MDVPDPRPAGGWRVRVRYVAPRRPHLPRFRVPAPPDPPLDVDLPGDDPVSAALGVVVLLVNVPWFLLVVLVWLPLLVAATGWLLVRAAVTAVAVGGGLLARLLLPLPWDVVAVRPGPLPHVHRTRVAGWPAALLHRHRLARRLASRTGR